MVTLWSSKRHISCPPLLVRIFFYLSLLITFPSFFLPFFLFLYPHFPFLLLHPSIPALVLSTEAWRRLLAVATRGPYLKQWHTFKSRGHLLCNSFKLPGFSGGRLTRPIATHLHRWTQTNTHTHAQRERERGGRKIKLEQRSRGWRERKWEMWQKAKERRTEWHKIKEGRELWGKRTAKRKDKGKRRGDVEPSLVGGKK